MTMRLTKPLRWTTFFVVLMLNISKSSAQLQEESVQAASIVFDEMMSVALPQIPESLLSEACGIAIIPDVIKGGFIVGARHGKGLLLVRDEQNNWQAPVFISLTGGNIGWQIGVQSTDVVLVFTSRKSVQGLLSGTFTIGADAAVAAGPLGRKASASTDARLKSEIFSYSRSRGAFAGVSIDGSVIRIEHLANAAYYQSPGPGQPATVPASALQLIDKVALRTKPPHPLATTVGHSAPVPPEWTSNEADTIRNQLATIAPELYQRLDAQWKIYLALPAEVFARAGHPSSLSLTQTLQRFDTVQNDHRFKTLANESGFRSTYGLLKQYLRESREANHQLTLPPPPASSRSTLP